MAAAWTPDMAIRTAIPDDSHGKILVVALATTLLVATIFVEPPVVVHRAVLDFAIKSWAESVLEIRWW